MAGDAEGFVNLLALAGGIAQGGLEGAGAILLEDGGDEWSARGGGGGKRCGHGAMPSLGGGAKREEDLGGDLGVGISDHGGHGGGDDGILLEHPWFGELRGRAAHTRMGVLKAAHDEFGRQAGQPLQRPEGVDAGIDHIMTGGHFCERRNGQKLAL